MLYSKAAAQRILKGLAAKVEAVRELPHVVQVTYRTRHGRCSTFVSKKTFRLDFETLRRDGAKALVSHQVAPGQYEVFNQDKGSRYQVWLGAQSVDCDCEDYQQQLQQLQDCCCKHGYHVLSTWLNVGSLAAYVTAQTSQLAA